MALLFYGKSVCSLCGKVIDETTPVRSFPAFILNELDPCFLFSDASFHEACVNEHPYGIDVLRRFDEWHSKVGPGKRICVVCKEEIISPDNYLLIEHLSDRESDPLRVFNYTHLHKSCIPRWKSRSRFIELANAALASGFWKGYYLNKIINELTY
jgi:hypothetical protein